MWTIDGVTVQRLPRMTPQNKWPSDNQYVDGKRAYLGTYEVVIKEVKHIYEAVLSYNPEQKSRMYVIYMVGGNSDYLHGWYLNECGAASIDGPPHLVFTAARKDFQERWWSFLKENFKCA